MARIYFTRIFKVFPIFRELRGDKDGLENFENTSEINPYHPRALAITCLPHIMGNILYKAKLLRSCCCVNTKTGKAYYNTCSCCVPN